MYVLHNQNYIKFLIFLPYDLGGYDYIILGCNVLYFQLIELLKQQNLKCKMGGQHFGELAKVRGIVTYKLSPFEQRAFAKAISHGVPNIFRRLRGSLFRVVPRKYRAITIGKV